MSFTSFRELSVPVHSDIVGDINIHTLVGGNGAPLLLLHGYPQTHRMWNKIADKLAEKFTVVIADLRGYGDSSKPASSESHVEYSKREMANDMVQVMSHLNYKTFSILAHDRGARVAHRLVLDHPGKVDRMLLMDILPTLTMFEDTDQLFASGYWHWFTLIQPGAEHIMNKAPEEWWNIYAGKRMPPGIWSKEDIAVYQDTLRDKDKAMASCEDYRAAATIDLEHDRTSRSNFQKVQLKSLRVLWGNNGIIPRKWNDPVGVWKRYCEGKVEVTGRGVESGHFIPEEKPEEVLEEALKFFGAE